MSGLARIAAFVRVAWLTLGIALVLISLLEVAMSVALWAANRMAGNASASGDYRAMADSYQGASWAADYYRELQASSKLAWAPYVYWRRDAFAGSYIKINERGIRHTVQEVAPSVSPAAPVRVFMFGGSTLWGTGVRDEFTIPSLLARDLRSRGIAAEITNFGESGYVSTQEVIALTLELRRQNFPDLVIFYDGVNDVFSAYQQAAAGQPQNEMHRIREFNLSQPDEWPRALGVTLNGLARSLSLARAARSVLGVVGVPPDPDAGSDGRVRGSIAHGESIGIADAVRETYIGNMRIVQALGKEYGFRSLFFWQPTIFEKPTLTTYEKGELAKETKLRSFFESVRNARLAGIASTSFYDFSDIFKTEEAAVFVDWCHVGEYGNSVIASAMAEALIAAGLLGRSLVAPNSLGLNRPQSLARRQPFRPSLAETMPSGSHER